MKKRIICLICAFVMALSLLPAMALAEAGSVQVDSKSIEDHMLHLDKSLSRNEDGTYSIKLESYATGVSKTTQVTEAVPTDFVLVLDQSGSMTDQDIPGGYTAVTQDWRPDDFLKVTYSGDYDKGYKNRPEVVTDELYYRTESGEYYRAYYKDRSEDMMQLPGTGWNDNIPLLVAWTGGAYDPNRQEIGSFTSYENWLAGNIGGHRYEPVNYDGFFGVGQDVYVQVPEKDENGNTVYTYYLVHMQNDGILLRYHVKLYYYDSDGVQHDIGTYTCSYSGANWIYNADVPITFYSTKGHPNTTSHDHGTNHYFQDTATHKYMLFYKDADGVEHQVANSINVDETGKTFYSGTLYHKNSTITRVQALKNAVTSFVNEVNSQAVKNDVNHKVAIAGFSDTMSEWDGGFPANTELLTGVGVSGKTGRQLNSISTTDYQNALQDVNTESGMQDLTNAIAAIDAEGGTEPDKGLTMAYNILENRTEKTYYNAADVETQRNTVVIFFTDGAPYNYPEDDMVKNANTIVDAARVIKNNAYNTKIYSVGIFATGDDQPLTFTIPAKENYNGQDNYLRTDEEYFYFRGNKLETFPHNDTIKDYMECVSSKYPSATNFLNHSGTSDTGTDQSGRGNENADGNTYYMKVTDTAGLQRAFESALTDVGGTTTEVVAGTSSEFQDIINTADFEIPAGAKATAYSVSCSTTDGVTFAGGNDAIDTFETEISSDGKVKVNGFDYSTNYTAIGKDGQKLIVEITGLLPKQIGEVRSNTSTTIKPDIEENPDLVALSLSDSPKDNIGESTIVIDYNYPVQLTDQLGEGSIKNASINGNRNVISNNKADGKSGTYKISGSTLTYRLLDDSINPGGTAPATGSTYTGSVLLKKYGGIDSAVIYTRDEGWKKVNTLPATSVYYSDTLTDAKTTLYGNGYNSAATSNAVRYDATDHGKQLAYTFTGTGIDVYSTTTKDGKYVVGILYDSAGNKVDSCTMKNASNETRVNVPSIFFHNLTYGTYTLKITASKNSDYLLDGIRIYNPAGSDSEAETVYEKNNEQHATFTNLREMLLEDGSGFGDGIGFFSDTNAAEEGDGAEQKTVTINFYDEDGNIDPSKSKSYSYYAHTLTAYQIEGPKNEIYLDGGNAIAFTVTNWKSVKQAYPKIKIMMGISAVRGGDGSVAINGEPKNVTQVDQYFDVTPGADGMISVANPSGSGKLISVTNLKVSGADKPISVNTGSGGLQLMSLDAGKSSQIDSLNIEVTEETVAFAAKLNAVRYAKANHAVIADETAPEDPEPVVVEPEEPTVEPTPEPTVEPTPKPDNHSSIQKILSSIVNKLFGRISRLFGK